MGEKKFLPVSSERDVEMPMMGGPAAAAAMGVYRDMVSQNIHSLPKATKTKSWVMKMFSALAFLGLIFGGTVVGFSFKIVKDNHVGYYTNETGYMGPGTYFQFPWTKEDMHIVDVGGLKFLRLDLVGQNDNITLAKVFYSISDVEEYVRSLKNISSPNYCQTEIETAVLEGIRNTSVSLSTLKVTNIPVNNCGIIISSITF